MPVKPDPRRAQEIGQRISEARRESGMTQRELGELIGVTERSVSAYESGDVIPFRFIRKLEEALDRPAAWLLHGNTVDTVTRDQQLQQILVTLHNQHLEILLELRELKKFVMEESPA